MKVKRYPEQTKEIHAPETRANITMWRNLPPDVFVQRLGDWAAMLEVRMAELDPNYQAHPWGQNAKSIWE